MKGGVFCFVSPVLIRQCVGLVVQGIMNGFDPVLPFERGKDSLEKTVRGLENCPVCEAGEQE